MQSVSTIRRPDHSPALPILVLLFAKIELTDLPGRSLIDETSVRVKGSGHCTILHVSYTDEPKEAIKIELVRRMGMPFLFTYTFFVLLLWTIS